MFKWNKTLATLVPMALVVALGSPLAAFADSSSSQVKAYNAITLTDSFQKNMDYYTTDEFSLIPGHAEVNAGFAASNTIPSDMKLLQAIGLDQITAYTQEGDTLWIGTKTGLQRINFKEANPLNYTQYLAGSRYMYNGDDRVTGLYPDGNQGVWVQNSKGVVHISMTLQSLKAKADRYEELTKAVNERNGMIGEDIAYSRNGEVYSGRPTTNDNDGLWTSEYAIGEIYRYLTAKQEGDQVEMAKAKADATRAAKAVMLLAQIAGRGNGFVVRSYIMQGESLPNGFWFKKQLIDGVPYGVAQDTSDAGKKEELRITDAVLVAEAKAAYLTATGHSYETDYGDKDIFPVIKDKAGQIVWQLKSPIVEDVDPMLSALYGGSANDYNVIYKADTSSDEVDGQMALLYFAANYLFDGTGNEDAHLKQLAIRFADRIVKGIVTHNFTMLDATGNPTSWARWNATYFAPQIDYTANTEGNPPGEYEGGYESDVNADEIVSFVKVATYLTSLDMGTYSEDNALFHTVYDKLWTPRSDGGSYDNNDSSYTDETSGIGYIDIMKQYIERKTNVISSDFDDYDFSNEVVQSGDWTRVVNYSDENLFAMAFLPLIDIEMNEDPNSSRLNTLKEVFDQWWANMKNEHNPFYTFLYQKLHPTDGTVDLGTAAWMLERMPQYRISFPVNNLNRTDVLQNSMFNYRDYYKINGVRHGLPSFTVALAPDEVDTHKFNSSPYVTYWGLDNITHTYNNVSYSSGSMQSGTWFTLPYWMGRYYGMLKQQ